MNIDINKDIGNRIKARRIELNMTQNELADKLNLKNRSTITRYEQGDKTFKQSQIIALSQALNTTPAYLMGWDEDNDHSNEVGNRLKVLRESHNITLVEMAKEFSISIEDLKKYENGSKVIPVEMLEKIASYFDVSTNDLTTIGLATSERTTLVTTDIGLAKMQETWFKEVGIVSFTDEELTELINYAKFILSKRKEG